MNNNNPYSRPNYETAEEYNRANGTGSQYGTTDTQNNTQYNYNTTDTQNNTQYNYNTTDTQNNTEYNYNTTQFANIGGQMVDGNGKPLRNYFSVQVVFAIIEIVCCCCLNIVSMVLGIIGLVFAIQSNSAYKQGNAEEFKKKSFVSNVLLIVGGVWVVISIIVGVIFSSFVYNVSDELWMDIEEGIYEEFGYDDEGYYEEYVGVDDVPLAEGFNTFTYENVSYTLPMDYAEFESMGYTLDPTYDEYSDADGKIEADDYEYISFFDENQNEVGVVGLFNYTDSELAPEECIVGYICFYNYAAYSEADSTDDIDLLFCNGLDMTATYEDIEAFMGTPTYVYASDENDEYANYSWYYYGEDGAYQCLDVTFSYGTISSISIEISEY